MAAFPRGFSLSSLRHAENARRPAAIDTRRVSHNRSVIPTHIRGGQRQVSSSCAL